ncbi:MAG TPA: hypothetical protein VF209_03245 [Patescibacteria group bacterium]
MATVVNTTPAGIERESYGISWVIGLLLLLLVVFVLFAYGLPALRSATTSPAVTVPERVDVNVNQNPGGTE